jgi:hypothetical protein
VATTITPLGQVHNVSGASFTAASTTLSAAASTFTNADIGSIVDSPCVFPGTKVTAVAGGGASATIAPGAKSTCSSVSIRLGFVVVSPSNITAASGSSAPYPGGRFVYNVLDNTPGTSYSQARDLVGFNDIPSGSKSPLCSSAHDTANGGSDDLISDNGFLPIPPHTSDGNNTGVSCFKF